MAAGRHGGYRDYEFRDRELNPEIPRRGDLYKSRGGYRGNDHGGHSRSRADELDKSDRSRVRIRQRDIKEREANGTYYHSSSSTSSSGDRDNDHPKVGGVLFEITDREPGELSSGSDEVEMYEPSVGANDVTKTGNEVSSPLGRKRKFSPIVWDREEKQGSPISRKEGTTKKAPLPPPPPLPRGFRPSPHHGNLAEINKTPPTESSNHEIEEFSTNAPPAILAYSLKSESPSVFMLLSPGHGDSIQLEEDDYVPTLNISASRWADESNSAGEEGEVSGEGNTPKRAKKLPHTELMEAQLNMKAGSEHGESMKEDSEGSRSKSFDYERDNNDLVPHTVVGDEVDPDKTGNMDVDEDDRYSNESEKNYLTDTDVEEELVRTPEPTDPPQRSINMLQGCRSVDEFERLNKIDEGTYGVVYRARDRKTGEIVALKKVKMEKEREGFPLTSLREINILLSFHHPSIVDVKEVVVGSNLDSIFMVMEYMEHDLKGLMETMKQPYSQSEVKCLMLQLLEGVKYLHDNWVLHRDLKTSNLLLNNRGELKICDFGLARQYGSPLKPYTHLVVTLWYRAPELLLGTKQYSTAIDMWSLGCIMAELLSKEPLFNGKTEFDQLDKIFRTLGTPNEKIWPGFSKLPGVKANFVKQPYNKLREKFPPTSFSGCPTLSESGLDLLNKLLTYDPEKRITAEDALNHEWFRMVPLPKSKDFMPTFPAQHAQDRRLRRVMKSPDPLEEQRRKELQGELGTGGLFG